MTVNLTRIYTKLGDGGETHLGDMSRVSKLHPRVEAYGTIDELNATLGVALLQPGLPETFGAWLQRVQNDLLDVGADLSVPGPPEESAAKRRTRTRLRVDTSYTEWLEQACDEVNAKLQPLRSFVIPGGTPAAAQRHLCRTVCRRAERRGVGRGARGAVGSRRPLRVRGLSLRSLADSPRRTASRRTAARRPATASAIHSEATRSPPRTSLGMCQARIKSEQPTATANAPPSAATAGRSHVGATSTAHSTSATAAVACPLRHAAGYTSA